MRAGKIFDWSMTCPPTREETRSCQHSKPRREHSQRAGVQKSNGPSAYEGEASMLVVEASRMMTDLLGSMGFSAISGSRSVLGPALVLAERQRAGPWRTFVYTLAAAELIADKLPFTPDRTARGPLLVRCASGAW